ncbi:MAG: PASTA domain-containing protein, partial [Magnetospirillum sp.]
MVIGMNHGTKSQVCIRQNDDHRFCRIVLWLLLTLLAGILPGVAVATEPVAVDDKVTHSFTGFALDRRTGQYGTLGTVTNVSTQAIQAPVILVLSNLSPASVSFANASGITADGIPYFTVPLADGVLDPGESVANILVRINNPQRVTPSFNRSVRGVLPAVNHPPTAEAGPDQSVFVGSLVTLDGSASTDLDGDPLGYHWQFAGLPPNSGAALAGADSLHPAFSVDLPGTYSVQLIVHDGQADSAPDSVTVSTQNSKPVAQAGPDQSAPVGGVVQLDGSASSDVDHDPLSHAWSLTGKPLGSRADLVGADTSTPLLTLDRAGHYEASLVVHDGQAPSDPDVVAIDTQNSAPVARAGADQTGQVGEGLLLDGTASSDVDGDALSYAWSLLNRPAGSVAVLERADQAQCGLVPDVAGEYVAQLIVRDGRLDSAPDTLLLTIAAPPPPNQPPALTSTPVATAIVGQGYAYAAVAHDPDGDTLTYALTLAPAGMSLDGATGLLQWTPGQAGIFPVSLRVEDGRGGVASQAFDLVVDNPPPPPVAVPVLTGLARSAAEAALLSAELAVGVVDFRHDAVIAAGLVLEQNPAAGVDVPVGTAVALTVSLGAEIPLPPDPASVAPPLDPTVATTLDAATEFLHTGANPIQTGVAPGTLEAKRAAVLRGRILDRAGQPLPGVTVTLQDHPEYGQTLSRADGYYDLAVNGGGVLTLNYEKAGRLPAQRQATPAWQDYAVVDDLVMIALDAQVSAIDLSDTAQPFQVAQGSPVSDADGQRQATILFPQGTQATMTLADGTQQALSTLHVRATEYTVGENGPKTMPGPLPPNSGYTYAVELSVDEALAAGATRVDFDRTLPVYVDNFIGFPTGRVVPVGWYDPSAAAWVASNNGRVIRIVSISAGSADIDSDSDGLIDSAAKLAALGITPAEQVQLAGLYPAGKSLWRVPVTHFSPWDFNWLQGLPQLPSAPSKKPANPPNIPTPKADPQEDCAREQPGSIIECENQVLGETLPVAGTPYTLSYRSDRVPGRSAAASLDIPLSGASLPEGVEGIELRIQIAGQVFEYSYPAAGGQTQPFAWDGKDVYGRTLYGTQFATVNIGYTYDSAYYPADSGEYAFGRLSSATASTPSSREPLTLWQEQRLPLEAAPASAAQGLGGWSLEPVHHYDPTAKKLAFGNGDDQSSPSNTPDEIETAAGIGVAGSAGDGGDAEAAELNHPQDIALGPDGSYYLVENSGHRVRRVEVDGTIRTVAGTGEPGYGGDGGPATQAQFKTPKSIALGPDGSLYIADYGNHRVRRIDPDGNIDTVAGNGNASGLLGDNGPATSATLGLPRGVAVGPDGTLYISQATFGGTATSNRVRRVDPNGTITTVAGYGAAYGYNGDNRAATTAWLNGPSDLAAGPDGTLYIADTLNNRIRRVGLDGIISTVAGTGSPGYNGDGGLATTAQLNQPYSIAVGPDGSLYIGDTNNFRVRRISPEGYISTYAGNGQQTYGGDGGPPTAAAIRAPQGVAAGAAGSLYIADMYNHRVRRVRPILSPYDGEGHRIPSADGGEIYEFSAEGQHLRTLDSLTGAVRHQFGYDSLGQIATITDGDGNLTTVERNALGQPNAIVAPDGQRTVLSLNGDYLASAANPAGQAYHMAYGTGGLLT